ncbi:MAG: molecular chaperone HtpG [bacterium]|nr:molecular chaperone HtpG [bacterium]
MPAELHSTSVNLSALIELLSKHLYSTPTVVIRELVQNAHDSCVRRKIEALTGSDIDSYAPKILITTDQARGILIIEDNGAGLTRDEIIEFIATIGSGYTRLLRENDLDREVNDSMIGYFGFGFLSAYVVTDRLDLTTTSYKDPNSGWHFVSTGAERYSIEPAEPRAIGTRIQLHLSEQFHDLADSYITGSLLERYCCLLPVPVYLNHHSYPVNNLNPPWRTGDNSTSSSQLQKKEALEFAERFEHTFAPLCTIPVCSTNESEARGLIWIQDASTYGTSDNRNVSVFIRGMMISRDERELLPDWAGFAGGVIESDALSPTASREDIQKDETYTAICRQLNDALVEGISKIAQEEKAAWRLIMSRHNEALLGAALCDDRLFELLAHDLKLPTSEGEMTIGAILKKSDNTIYVSINEQSGYEEVIFRSLMTPIVAGFRYAALPFCLRYGELYGIPIVKLGTEKGNRHLFAPEHVEPENLEKLESLLQGENRKIIPAAFKPDFLPMVLIPDREQQLKNRIESDEADRRISTAALGLARLYTGEIEEKVSAYLYVNMNSPVIQRILELSGEKLENAAALLRSFTHLLSGHHEKEIITDISGEFKTYSEAVLKLLS